MALSNLFMSSQHGHFCLKRGAEMCLSSFLHIMLLIRLQRKSWLGHLLSVFQKSSGYTGSPEKLAVPHRRIEISFIEPFFFFWHSKNISTNIDCRRWLKLTNAKFKFQVFNHFATSGLSFGTTYCLICSKGKPLVTDWPHWHKAQKGIHLSNGIWKMQVSLSKSNLYCHC